MLILKFLINLLEIQIKYQFGSKLFTYKICHTIEHIIKNCPYIAKELR
jgi:hypothetical protein